MSGKLLRIINRTISRPNAKVQLLALTVRLPGLHWTASLYTRSCAVTIGLNDTWSRMSVVGLRLCVMLAGSGYLCAQLPPAAACGAWRLCHLGRPHQACSGQQPLQGMFS